MHFSHKAQFYSTESTLIHPDMNQRVQLIVSLAHKLFLQDFLNSGVISQN